jgi:peptidyl-prolyl cis-trans isomerase A (cyclophilin A)
MIRARSLLPLLLSSPLALAAGPAADKDTAGKWTKAAQDGRPLYATLKTNEGDIVVMLYSKDAPKTVANFVGLASGEKEWTDPKTHQKARRPLYDGTIFHRVIPNFMVQGGDPLGNGTGDPGYKFEDEFKSGLKFDKVGLLAMANSGPGTNGSQFFITVAKTPWLNNKHTIFGEVVSGYNVVEKISTVPTSQGNRPNKDVVLTKVVVTDKAPKGVKPSPKPG